MILKKIYILILMHKGCIDFPKSSSHLEILGIRRVTSSIFYYEDSGYWVPPHKIQ